MMIDGLITLDTTASTLDSTTAFTWDADIILGIVEIVWATSLASFNLRLLGTLTIDAIEFDRRMYRAPYSNFWFLEGDGRPNAQLVRVSADVWDDRGITYAQNPLRVYRERSLLTTRVRAAFGSFDVAAMQSYSYTPIESGYRVEIVFVTLNGRS